MNFHFPGQEHTVPVTITQNATAPKPAPPATAKVPAVLHEADVRRRALAVELALRAAGNQNDMTFPKGRERLMHTAYTLERYLATGIPTVFSGAEPPPNNGAHAAEKRA